MITAIWSQAKGVKLSATAFMSVALAFAFFAAIAESQVTKGQSATSPSAILAGLHPRKAAVVRPSRNTGFPRSEYSLQLTGLLLAKPTGGQTSRLAPSTIGFNFGMRDYINRWEALEAEVAYSHNGAAFFSPATAPKTTNVLAGANASFLRVGLNEVITASAHTHFQPFLVAGGGIAEFKPAIRSERTPRAQVRPIVELGVGVNVRLDHLGFRFEAEGLFYRTPSFHNQTISTGWTHVLQPSAGLILSF